MQQINHDVSEELVKDLLKEKKSDRRWRNIRFFLWFLLFAYTIFTILHWFGRSSVATSSTHGKYVSVLYLDGMIAPGREFSARELVPMLRDAFADKNSLGIMIDINSPGGTPVQASIIHDSIVALKNKYHKKVVIVGEDLLTSGAYYVAVAADKIYVNPNTLTGSIGVIMKGFGFVDLMKKIGVERRVYTAGDNKDRLDPFLPQSPDDVKKVSQVMGEVHRNFVQAVMEGRKGKLHADPAVLFSGDFWSGQSAQTLGLVDNLGNLMEAMEREFGTTTNYRELGGTNFFKFLGAQLSSTFDGIAYL